MTPGTAVARPCPAILPSSNLCIICSDIRSPCCQHPSATAWSYLGPTNFNTHTAARSSSSLGGEPTGGIPATFTDDLGLRPTDPHPTASVAALISISSVSPSVPPVSYALCPVCQTLSGSVPFPLHPCSGSVACTPCCHVRKPLAQPVTGHSPRRRNIFSLVPVTVSCLSNAHSDIPLHSCLVVTVVFSLVLFLIRPPSCTYTKHIPHHTLVSFLLAFPLCLSCSVSEAVYVLNSTLASNYTRNISLLLHPPEITPARSIQPA